MKAVVNDRHDVSVSCTPRRFSQCPLPTYFSQARKGIENVNNLDEKTKPIGASRNKESTKFQYERKIDELMPHKTCSDVAELVSFPKFHRPEVESICSSVNNVTETVSSEVDANNNKSSHRADLGVTTDISRNDSKAKLEINSIQSNDVEHERERGNMDSNDDKYSFSNSLMHGRNALVISGLSHSEIDTSTASDDEKTDTQTHLDDQSRDRRLVLQQPEFLAPRPAINNNNLPVKAKRVPQHPKFNCRQPKQKKFEQLYLDVGQKDFGKQILCRICGMLFVHGLSEDAKQHKDICIQYQRGVSFVVPKQGTKGASRIVHCFHLSSSKSFEIYQWPKKRKISPTDQKAYILEVRPSDDKNYLTKLQDVISIAKIEIGFAGRPSLSERSCNDLSSRRADTCYICVVNNRVVALVMIEKIKEAYSLIKETATLRCNDGGKCNYSSRRSLHARPAMLGVYLLWVHAKYRGMGIAKQLIDIARDKMFYGLHVPIDHVAFSSPTQAGLSFAWKYCTADVVVSKNDAENIRETETRVLVYDCDMRT